MGDMFLLKTLLRSSEGLIILLPVVFILLFIFEKNPKIENDEDKK